MVCEKKWKLLESYQQATRKHSDAVTELNGKIGRSSKADYGALYRKTEALRIDMGRSEREFGQARRRTPLLSSR
jgi:hypothetical protein